MKQLERLLFLQGNRCFLCRNTIPNGEASVEHLVATSNGGAKDDENCVVCCKSVNAALGSLSIKAKLQVVINQGGAFVCPQFQVEDDTFKNLPDPIPKDDGRLEMVVADLVKRGQSRPRKVATLRNTINALFQNKLTEDEVSVILDSLQKHKFVTVSETKVSYSLPTA